MTLASLRQYTAVAGEDCPTCITKSAKAEPKKASVGSHPDRKLSKASPASMRASLRYNFNQCSAAALERGLSTTYPFQLVRRMGETNTQSSCKGNTYSSMALTGQQADLGCRRRPNRFEARSWRVFPPDVIKEKTTVTGKSAMSAVFTWPRSPAQSPEQNKVLKKTSSQAVTNCSEALRVGKASLLLRWLESSKSLSEKKNGTLCLGVTRTGLKLLSGQILTKSPVVGGCDPGLLDDQLRQKWSAVYQYRNLRQTCTLVDEDIHRKKFLSYQCGDNHSCEAESLTQVL